MTAQSRHDSHTCDDWQLGNMLGTFIISKPTLSCIHWWELFTQNVVLTSWRANIMNVSLTQRHYSCTSYIVLALELHRRWMTSMWAVRAWGLLWLQTILFPIHSKSISWKRKISDNVWTTDRRQSASRYQIINTSNESLLILSRTKILLTQYRPLHVFLNKFWK